MSNVDFKEYTRKHTPMTISEILEELPFENKRVYLACTNSVMGFVWVHDNVDKVIYDQRLNHWITWFFRVIDFNVCQQSKLKQRYALDVSFDPKRIENPYNKPVSEVMDLTTDNLREAFTGWRNDGERDVKAEMFLWKKQSLGLYLESIISWLCVDIVHKDDGIILFFD